MKFNMKQQSVHCVHCSPSESGWFYPLSCERCEDSLLFCLFLFLSMNCSMVWVLLHVCTRQTMRTNILWLLRSHLNCSNRDDCTTRDTVVNDPPSLPPDSTGGSHDGCRLRCHESTLWLQTHHLYIIQSRSCRHTQKKEPVYISLTLSA